jgi:hypothetical protein
MHYILRRRAFYSTMPGRRSRQETPQARTTPAGILASTPSQPTGTFVCEPLPLRRPELGLALTANALG